MPSIRSTSTRTSISTSVGYRMPSEKQMSSAPCVPAPQRLSRGEGPGGGGGGATRVHFGRDV